MTPKTKETLETHKHLWNTLQKAGYVKHLPMEIKVELQAAYHDIVNKDEHITLWCGDCVAEMIERLYRTYERNSAKGGVKETIYVPAADLQAVAPSTTLTHETPAEPVPHETTEDRPKGKPGRKPKTKTKQ